MSVELILVVIIAVVMIAAGVAIFRQGGSSERIDRAEDEARAARKQADRLGRRNRRGRSLSDALRGKNRD